MYPMPRVWLGSQNVKRMAAAVTSNGVGDSLGIEVIPADSEAKGGVDPSCSEMGESSRDRSEVCHLPDGTKRRVGHGSDWARGQPCAGKGNLEGRTH